MHVVGRRLKAAVPCEDSQRPGEAVADEEREREGGHSDRPAEDDAYGQDGQLDRQPD